ncbi:MAG: branched-chain amino acid aminotransferase [Thermoplasmata archaeon]|jgi:branched-chain amino acid aminotransferase|nr:branched-chain amino acid aminotransferase [Thermoplasmata archaeon]
MAEYKVYLNGAFVPESEAKISVYDHGFLYGDGVFEGIRAYNGRIFRLDEHVDRLYESAKAIGLEIPVSKKEMAELLLESCRVNNLRDAYIRPIVARGVGDLGLDPRKCKTPTMIVLARSFGALYGDKYEKGLKLCTVSVRRNSPNSLSPNIKSLNYLNNILAKLEVNAQGADEGIMLDLNGFVSEATADNIFLVRKGVVLTPPTYNSLKGITRGAVLDIARDLGLPVEEHPITMFDVYNADEVFITGTAAEVAPCVEVDHRVIGEGRPGPVTKRLIEGFRKLTTSTGTPIFGAEAAAKPKSH